MNVDYPMLFQLKNQRMNRSTHCGVYEFSAQEGCCYLPFWMMQNLMIGEGALVTVKNVSLPRAKFVKFRPQSVEFLEISNPRAVLEKTLRSYTCVTRGDQICINYLNKRYYLEVIEVKPGTAACIVETDCEVDFDEPVGYVPPPKPTTKTSTTTIPESTSSSSLNSKTTTTTNSAPPSNQSKNNTPSGTPRNVQKARSADEAIQQEEELKKFKPFIGKPMRIDGRNTTTVSPNTTTVSPSPSSTTLSTTTTTTSSQSTTSSSLAPSSSSSSSTSKLQSPISKAGEAALTRQSLVGNKYSTKKVAASAFHGKASTLSGSK